jgi:selT/selW/selH-like putative selenoprotein
MVPLAFFRQSTPSVTGFFEVTVNGQLVHSKKNGGGFPSAAQVAQIKATIEALLKN